MNNPASTIHEFTHRLENIDEISYITPLYTLRPSHASSKLSRKLPRLPNPTTLQSLIQVITATLSTFQLPLDPTLPRLSTPDTIPLKPVRPASSTTPLLPADVVNHTNPFPAFLSAQVEHLQRVSHYNYNVLEISSSKIITRTANEFCETLIALLPDQRAFKSRFGVLPTSSDAIALISALKVAREAVVPVGDKVFLQARGGADKLKTRNRDRVNTILKRTRSDNGYSYRKFRITTVVVWLVILLWSFLVIGIGVWPDGRTVQRALVDSANVLQLGLVLLILSLGVGKEFWSRFGILLGWRAWRYERDIRRDVGAEGSDALVAAVLSEDLVDHVVTAFGVGEGAIRLREWVYDPRFGFVVGEKSAFCTRGRRWYKVVKEDDGETLRYRLFPSDVRRAFVGVGVGVTMIDGGKEKEVV